MRYPFIFSAGGTGGHIFPALSVMDFLNSPVLLLTGKYGMEKKILSKERVPFKTLPIKGISEVSFLKKIMRFPGIFVSLFFSLFYILKYKPKVIVGFGGYASFPVLFWARFLKIQYFLQEQNSIPGQVTRFFSKGARAIFTGFPDTEISGNKIYTGNPLRREFYNIPIKEKITLPINLFIIGGSQGSKFLDETIGNILPFLKGIPLSVIHQARSEDISFLAQKYKESGIEAKIYEFIEKPWEIYQKADLVISRAGALTVSEVISSGRCAIFIPFKGAAENHQYWNALWLSKDGAAFLIEENEKTGENLLKVLREILNRPEILIEMGKRAKEREVKDGMDLIRKFLLKAAGGGNAFQEI
ncbi:MAG: undecaprenyldiphospho-muramoylpentapeptide beta-N-acetylglucosaminyltransferase [Thermoanaerobaculia bacterium]